VISSNTEPFILANKLVSSTNFGASNSHHARRQVQSSSELKDGGEGTKARGQHNTEAHSHAESNAIKCSFQIKLRN
jgi:hypothetical protein